MSDIKIPGVGPVKKQYAIAGGLLIVVIVGVAYSRHKKAAAAPVDPAAAQATPTDSGMTSVDTTGSSTGGYYPSGGTPYSPYGYDIFGNQLPAPTGATTTGGTYTTNNDWLNAAESALENAGISLSVSTTAISKVLAGISVTPAQKDIFLQAVGILGQPPQGYPTPIKLTETPSSGGQSNPPPKPTGLKVTRVDRTEVDLDWAPSKGATGYRVFMNGKQLITVTYSQFAAKGLHPHSHYAFAVEALGSNNKASGKSATVGATTKK